MDQDRHDLTQRFRIGLTGLACVFLLVLLGAIFVKFVRDGEASRPPEPALAASSGGAANSSNMVEEAPKEPLAELGVAPGNVPPSEEQAPTHH